MENYQKSMREIADTLVIGRLTGNKHAIITNIQFNSQQVVKNSLFCALSGLHNDGHNFIPDAIARGATGIICNFEYKFTDAQLEKVAAYQLSNNQLRKAMAEVSAILYDFPHEQIKMIGVTGTDGKSTTIYYIHQLLKHIGVKAGFFSTVEQFNGIKYLSNEFRQSTPEAPQIHKALRDMVKNNCHVAILETTSHGLSPKTARTHGLVFDVGILTNVRSEHLDFHGTVEQYANDKSFLFAKVKSQGLGILRKEEPYHNVFHEKIRYNGAQLATYSIKDKGAQYFATNLVQKERHIEGKIVFSGDRVRTKEESELYLHCIGNYNIENMLAAVAAVHQLHIPFKEIIPHISKLIQPKGRMNLLRTDLPVLPIIDYAHTPASFETILPMIKKMTKRKLIVVFGSAGERDQAKRAEQGKIADRYADIIFLTDEDPREEDPMAIITQIAEGCKKHKENKDLFFIPNRRQAITQALRTAKAGDTILFLGKGHEQSIEYAGNTIKWDEETEVTEAIRSVINIVDWYNI